MPDSLLSRIPVAIAAPAAVLAGGVLGSALRAGVGLAIPPSPGAVPVATLAVNVFGSFALGFYLTRRERAVVSRFSLQFWAIGVLGSLTTFSTFSYEVFVLVEAGSMATALVYGFVSTVGGLMAAVVGSRIGEAWR
ncbi:MAG: CrcB family protein [Acidimicrobiia bacterium]